MIIPRRNALSRGGGIYQFRGNLFVDLALRSFFRAQCSVLRTMGWVVSQFRWKLPETAATCLSGGERETVGGDEHFAKT